MYSFARCACYFWGLSLADTNYLGEINPNPSLSLIVGNNLAEGNLWAYFLTFALEIDEPTYLALVNLNVPAAAVSQILDFYAPLAASQGYWQALSQMMVSFS